MSRASRLGSASLVTRHLSVGSGPSLAVAVTIFLLATVATAAPLATQALYTDGIRYEVDRLTATQRDLTATAVGIPPIGSAPDGTTDLDPPVAEVWGDLDAALADVRAGMAPVLRDATADADYVQQFDPIPLEKGADPAEPLGEVLLSFDPRFLGRVDVVEGSAPAPIPPSGTVEIVLSRPVANRMQWTVGDERPIVESILGEPAAATATESRTVRLVGIYAPRDPGDGYWQHLPNTLLPTVRGESIKVIGGVAYADAASWPAVEAIPVASRTIAWFPLGVASLDAATVDELRTAIGRFTRENYDLGTGGGLYFQAYAFDFSSGILPSLDTADARAQTTAAVLAMSASGPFGVAVAVLYLGCRFITIRRRPGAALAEARGASRVQSGLVRLIEGALVGLPAAALGGAAASALIPGSIGVTRLLVPVAIGLLPAVLLVAAPPASAMRGRRADLLAGRASVARRVIELVIVALAITAVALLVQRGAADSADSLDPLVAATPLLLAAVACIVVLRLYPLPLALLARRGRMRPGLVPFLGPVRGIRDPGAGAVPVLALVVGVSIAVFSSVLLSTVQEGVVAAARLAVGADARVEAPAITADQLDTMRDEPGVTSIAPVYVASRESVESINGRDTVTVLVVDSEEVRSVQASIPGAITLPSSLSEVAQPVPVVASRELLESTGGREGIELGGEPVTVVGPARSDIPLTASRQWMIVDRVNAEALIGTGNSPGRVLVDLDPGTGQEVLDRLGAVLGPSAVIATPDGTADATRSNPAVVGVQFALLVAVAVTGVLSALAVVLTLLLAGRERATMLARLVTLGLDKAQVRAIAAWEIGPPAVTALLVGTLLGLAIPLLVIASVDLRPFTGGAVAPTIVVDPWLVSVVLVGFLAVVAGCLTIASFASRSVGSARAVRSGEEG